MHLLSRRFQTENIFSWKRYHTRSAWNYSFIPSSIFAFVCGLWLSPTRYYALELIMICIIHAPQCVMWCGNRYSRPAMISNSGKEAITFTPPFIYTIWWLKLSLRLYWQKNYITQHYYWAAAITHIHIRNARERSRSQQPFGLVRCIVAITHKSREILCTSISKQSESKLRQARQYRRTPIMTK